MRRSLLAITLSVVVSLVAISAAAAAPPETADVWDQGTMATVYAPGGAQLVRQANGISVKITMPTPEPDTYVYPPGTGPGHPEVFTLWAFVFNNPGACSDDECGPDDMGNPDVGWGAYNPGGHVNAGNNLTLSGRIGIGDPAGGPPGTQNITDLYDPMGAEVHLAVTSHGALDPSTLPGEFRRPTGNGSHWWVAVFD